MTLTERPPSLSNSDRKVLCALYERDLTSAQIAEVLRVDRKVVSSYLDTLRRKGLVKHGEQVPNSSGTESWLWRAT